MTGRATSAAYRIPTVSSSYHEKCIAPSVKAIQESSSRGLTAGEKAHPQHLYRSCDAVTQEKIWKEHCQKEQQQARKWDKHWGFYTEYDFKGERRSKRELPAKVSYYSTSVPHTTSQQVGTRMGSHNHSKIAHLEMLICHRKRKTDLKGELIY